MGRLARNVSANLLANAWATLLSLALTPVYLRFLGVESYGLIGFYMSWVAMLSILDTAISATALREIAWLVARPAERSGIAPLLRSLEVAYWAIICAIGAVLLGCAAWFGPDWFEAGSLGADVLRQTLILMVVSLLAQVPSGLYVGGLMGLQHQVQCSAQVAVFGTIRGVGAIGVLAFAGADIRFFFLWQIAASALQTAAMRASLYRRIAPFGGVVRFSPALLHRVRGFAGGIGLVTAIGLMLAQADKLILSRFVPLEVLGFYMLAWTVASGLSRIATPLIQAFSPRFTQMASTASDELGAQLHLACQLTSALLLPPAALLVVYAQPILTAWTGDHQVAVGSGPLLAILAIGTASAACGYPALSMLYGVGRIRAVIVVNLVSLAVMCPLLVIGVTRQGPLAAALIWTAYGPVSYLAYEWIACRHLGENAASAILRDLIPQACTSAAVAMLVWSWVAPLQGRLEIAGAIAVALAIGWAAAIVASRELLKVVIAKRTWKLLVIP